ncbi:MAG TPA: PAS domain-containing protein [Magnetospirillaceae bacterium]|jgi:PAS domain S-box-containing protein
MVLPDSGQLAPWLTSLGGNVVAGGAAIMLYAAIKGIFDRESRLRDSLAIGLIFGCAALVAMRFTIEIGSGIIIDTRNVFILIGSLFGGPIGAGIATVMTAAYRLTMGGIGAAQGFVSIFLTGALGTAIALRYGERVRAFGYRELGAVALAEAVLTVLWRRFYYDVVVDLPGLPLGAEIAVLITFVLSILLLGTAMSMTHYRIWWQTENRLSDLLTTASDLVWETDLERRLTFVSGRHLAILGYTPDELIGRPIDDFRSGWLTDEDRAAFSAARTAHRPFSDLTAVMKTKDGTERLLLTQGVPMFDANRRFIGYRGTATDITDRERMVVELRDREEELRISRDHLARAQQVAAVASIDVDLLTLETLWSDHAYKLFDLDPGPTIPDLAKILSAVHPADRDLLGDSIKESRRGHDTANIEFRVVHRNGDVRWLHRIALIVRDAGGKPIRITSTIRDITAQRKNDDALRASQEHLLLAQEVAHLASGEVDLATGVVSLSDTSAVILDFDMVSEPITYALFMTRVHPEDLPMISAIFERTRRGEDTEPAIFRFIHKAGPMRWLQRNAAIRRNEAGVPTTAVITYLDVTERVEMEGTLRQSREHLALAQQVGQIGSAELHIKTGKTRWSDAWFNILGLDPKVAVAGSDTYLACIHPDDRDLVKSRTTRSHTGQTNEPSEYRIVRPDGETRWIYTRTTVLGDTAIATLQDITDRKRAEIELRERENQLLVTTSHLASAQRVGKMGSVEIDPQTGWATWSAEQYHLLGFDQAKGRPSADQYYGGVHPDDRQRLRDIRARELSSHETEPVDYRWLGSGGPMRWIRRHAELIRDADGKPTRWIAVHQDITEERRSAAQLIDREAQLNRSREHLAIAQLIAKLGSIELDLRTNELYWSEEVYRILGVEPAAVPSVGQFRAVVHPDDLPTFDDVGQRVREGHDVEPSELRLLRPDGETRWILRSVRVFRDDAGNLSKSVATLQDITDLKKAQFERQQLERQLTQAQKMEAVGNLTGGVAHDFNNLLSVMLGRLEMAEEDMADRPEVREWIRTCIKAAHRGAALTRSMLAFSRQQALQPVDLDLGAVVGEMMELLPRTLGETIEIRTIRSESLWSCRADPAQVQNALLNLALNARDAMPGGGTLSIETSNAHLDEVYAMKATDVTPGDYVCLSVSDTGTGMPPDVIARACEPFFTTKEVGKGSGLGLSMVYGFVKQSGGHLRIYSEVGTGTTIQLYFPRGASKLTAVEAPQDQWRKVADGETVLVVEDDEDMRALAVTQLERLGYLVFAGTNAAEGLSLVRQHPKATLLLTDITLPGGKDGRKLAEEAVQHSPSLKILLMSGYSESMLTRSKPSDIGIPLLQKPFGIRDLIEKLRIVIA